MTPEEYCREKTKSSGSSFYYAFRLLNAEQRRAMMALYAFCREVDDIADDEPDDNVAREKIGEWREEIERTWRNEPAHPVGIELNRARQRFSLDEELFIEMLDGMLMDIGHKRYIKPADLALYCYRVAGVVGLLSIEIFGYSGRRARDFATAMGEALQLTNILRDLKEDALRGRIYIPEEERQRFGVADEEFAGSASMTPNMHSLMKQYAKMAEERYRDALDRLPPEDRTTLRPSLLMGAIYHTYLKRLAGCDYDVWSHPMRMSKFAKMRVALKAWLYEKRAEKQPESHPPTFDF